MARSSYVYLIVSENTKDPLYAFTVKYEAKRKIGQDLYKGLGWAVVRLPDGGQRNDHKYYSVKEFMESKP